MQYGEFKSLVLTNRQCIFERESINDRVMIAVNADEKAYHADFNARAGRAQDLITKQTIDFGGGLDIPAYTAYMLQPF